MSTLERLRKICLAFPEAHEKIAWGEPTFRVRNKLFAMYASSGNHHGAGKNAVWCKATRTDQELLIRADPAVYFSPPYVGPSGWIGIYLVGNVDWRTVADHLHDAYRLIAPKKLLQQATPSAAAQAPAAPAKRRNAAKRPTKKRAPRRA